MSSRRVSKATRFSSRARTRTPTPVRRTTTRPPPKRKKITKRTPSPPVREKEEQKIISPIISPVIKTTVKQDETGKVERRVEVAPAIKPRPTRIPVRTPTRQRVTKRTPSPPVRQPPRVITRPEPKPKPAPTPKVSAKPKPKPKEVKKVEAPPPKVKAAPKPEPKPIQVTDPRLAPKPKAPAEGGGPSFIGGVTTVGERQVALTEEEPRVEPRPPPVSPQEEIVRTQEDIQPQGFTTEREPVGQVEESVIERILEEQDVARQANLLQKQRFDAITGASTAQTALQIAERTREPKVFFTFGPEDERLLETPEGRARLEEKLKTTPRPSLQESLGFGIPQAQPAVATIEEQKPKAFGPPEPETVKVETPETLGPPEEPDVLDPVKTKIIQDAEGNVTVQTDVATPDTILDPLTQGVTLKEEDGRATVKGIPLIAGVPGLLGGAALFAGGAATKQSPINPDVSSPVGFFIPESAARQQALNLEKTVLSREPIPETVVNVPAGEPQTIVGEPETITFTDPRTGQRITQTTTPVETITPQAGTIIKGGEIQEIGLEPVRPDFSDPIGSIFSGISQELSNELIGITSLHAQGEKLFAQAFAPDSPIAKPGTRVSGRAESLERRLGLPKDSLFNPQPDIFATPTGITFETIPGAVREGVTGGDPEQFLEQRGQQLTRTIQADPLFAISSIGTFGATLLSPTKIARGVQGLTRLGARRPVIQQLGESRLLTRVAPTKAEELRRRAGAQKLKRREEQLPLSQRIKRQEFQRPEAPELIEEGSEDLLRLGAARGQPPLRRISPPRTLTETQRRFEREFVGRGGREPPFATLGEARLRIPFEPTGPKIDPRTGAPFGTGTFQETVIPLGRGVGRFERLGDEGLGGVRPPKPPTPPKPPKVTPKEIDELSKRTGVTKQRAREILNKQKRAVERTGDPDEFRVVSTEVGLQQLVRATERTLPKSTRLKNLEKASTILRKPAKTKTDDAFIKSLIKSEKKLTPEKLTQNALRGLIKQEKVRIGIRALEKGGVKAKSVLRRTKRQPPEQPPTLRIVEDVPLPRRRPPGPRGRITAAGAAGVIGSGVLIPAAQQSEAEQIFTPFSSVQQPDPLRDLQRDVQRTVIEQPQRTGQKDIQDFTFGQPERTPNTERTITRFEDIFGQRLRQEQRIAQPGIVRQQLLFGGGRFPPFGEPSVTEPRESRARRFFRVFEVARTPFGRISRPLGTQAQAERPIFEVEDVFGRAQRRNIGERFFETF